MMKMSKSKVGRIEAVQRERVMLMKLAGRFGMVKNNWKIIIIKNWEIET